MLTICLDESGVFEDDNYNKPLIIGGIIYVGEDVKEEEARLRNFYINACKEMEYELSKKLGRNIEIAYPNGIHSTDNKGNIGREINKLLGEKVINYIKKNDKYYLTAMVKSKDMKESFNELADFNEESDVIDSVLDFNKGANLYERMATKFLYNNIFYNPILKEHNQKINLNLATRTISVKKDSEIYKELVKLNYNSKENKDGTLRFFVTGPSTFKAALSTKIYESSVNRNIDYTLSVESINYKKEGTTPFLYIADNICDILKEQSKEIKGGFDILKFVNVMKEKVNKEFICFIHDDIDLIWTRLVERLNEKDLIGALEKIAEIENSLNDNKKLYIDFWIPKIESELINIFDKYSIENYLLKLDGFFNKDKSEYEKGMIIAKRLLKVLDYVDVRSLDLIKYKINEKIALAHNHRGAISKAIQHFNICESLKSKGIQVTDYLNTLNRKTVALSNACAFEKSIEELKLLLPQYIKIKDIYLDIAADMDMESEDSFIVREEGKILSGIGQNLSFIKKYDEAEKYFNEALQAFSSKGDYGITKSFLVHMYIDSKNREKYEENIVELLGSKDLKEQLDKIFDNPKKVDRYLLFIYTKALNELYEEIVDNSLLEKLINNVNKMINDSKFNQHPKEMIIKNVSQLAFKKGFKTEAEYLMKEHLDDIKEADFTIRLIVEKARIDYLCLKKGKIHENNKVERDKIDKEIAKHIDVIKEVVRKEELAMEIFNNLLITESSNIGDCLEILNNRLSYMYN